MPRTASTAPTRFRRNGSRRSSRSCKSDPAWSKPTDPALEARFERVKAKLLGFVDPKQAVLRYPESDQSVPAHYARAYAYHLGGYPDKAEAEADALLAGRPGGPLLPRAQGPDPARGRQAQGRDSASFAKRRKRSDNAPMIAAMLGHALVATDDAKNFPEAKQMLKAAVDARQ